MMDSADLYLTKPGGLSTSEAAAKRLPMVLIDAVAGCEEYNRNYFVAVGGAVTAEEPEELAALCLDLVRDQTKISSMRSCLQELTIQNAAVQIREILSKQNI